MSSLRENQRTNARSPYSQRVWIALEAKKLPYQYIETDPSKRSDSTELLEANPRGTVPAIQQGDWTCAGSGVLLEYVSLFLGYVSEGANKHLPTARRSRRLNVIIPL